MEVFLLPLEKQLLKFETSHNHMSLVQLGADVEIINGKMCYVKFLINDLEISYIYHINKTGKYFLERIKPYPLPIKEFENEDDVLKIIKVDIKQFENATNSSNIDNFVAINRALNKTIKKFEDLFLYYNVPDYENEIIIKKIKEIQDEINKTANESKRIFFEKEPLNI